MNVRERLALWKYRRRARRIQIVAGFLGWDEARTYAERRGWLEPGEDPRNLYIRRTGRWFR